MSIRLTLTVDNVNTVLLVYDRAEIRRADDEAMTTNVDYPIILSPSNLKYIPLVSNVNSYSVVDPTGTSNDWYQSRYYSSSVSGTYSGWSDPVKGEAGDLFYNPCRAPELTDITSSEQLVIDEIRRLIGDPKDINREYGDEAASSIHPDGMTYELDEKGWPLCITMGGEQYIDSYDPTINGYRYLIFNECINTTEVICSGTCNNSRGVDIWYYTFRWSDRQILEAYNDCPPPPPLTSSNVTSQAYILYTAKRLLQSENWHDAIEDGAEIRDEGTTYNPSPGFNFRKALLDDLNKQLDDLIKSLILAGIEGVRVE